MKHTIQAQTNINHTIQGEEKQQTGSPGFRKPFFSKLKMLSFSIFGVRVEGEGGGRHYLKNFTRGRTTSSIFHNNNDKHNADG